jgi:hypothetical protein
MSEPVYAVAEQVYYMHTVKLGENKVNAAIPILAQEADCYADEASSDLAYSPSWFRIRDAKLAQLIKHEIFNNIESWLDARDDTMKDDAYWHGYQYAMQISLDEVKFFGTEN